MAVCKHLLIGPGGQAVRAVVLESASAMPNLDLEPAAAVESRLASSREIATPAFVYDEAGIDRLVDTLDPVRRATGCKVLFSLKAFSFIDAVEQMAPRLDGFAASSLFEARLAREVCGRGAEVHLTSPGIRPGEVDDLGSLCDYVSFNSMSHLRVYGGRMAPYTSLGLRVNPQLSFVPDDRYDPCRPHSKLGVPLERLTATVAADRGQIAGVEGVHVHSNCDSTDLSQLLRTVRHLGESLGPLLHGMRWINLGGGYLFDEAGDIGPVIEAVSALESTYGLQVYLEPGAALVRSAGFVVASVLDVFPSEGVQVAVLDTTVNHMPEVLEYGFEPDVCGHDEEGEVEYLLAGSTCLAGDVFGVYRFAEPLEIGARVVFGNAGAYTLSKAHTFNGVNLPSVYALDISGGLTLKKRFGYGDYAERWRVGSLVSG